MPVLLVPSPRPACVADPVLGDRGHEPGGAPEVRGPLRQGEGHRRLCGGGPRQELLLKGCLAGEWPGIWRFEDYAMSTMSDFGPAAQSFSLEASVLGTLACDGMDG